jgi:hypothetical protein
MIQLWSIRTIFGPIHPFEVRSSNYYVQQWQVGVQYQDYSCASSTRHAFSLTIRPELALLR